MSTIYIIDRQIEVFRRQRVDKVSVMLDYFHLFIIGKSIFTLTDGRPATSITDIFNNVLTQLSADRYMNFREFRQWEIMMQTEIVNLKWLKTPAGQENEARQHYIASQAATAGHTVVTRKKSVSLSNV